MIFTTLCLQSYIINRCKLTLMPSIKLAAPMWSKMACHKKASKGEDQAGREEQLGDQTNRGGQLGFTGKAGEGS